MATQTESLIGFLAFVSALGAALIAGVFFAFSSFVMQALARLPSREGIAAMQSINVAVINRAFLGVFLGTAVLSALAIVAALLRWHAPASLYLLAGGALYLFGSLGVTIAFNIPRNERLARADAAARASAALWERYVIEWTAWNHLRGAASLAAAAAFMLALAA
ncbi:MAG: anthrone oxygenase family protein [Burkholderiales bacterium]|nr:anthrone oxygenase family protein [Burkholderiales bacterium]